MNLILLTLFLQSSSSTPVLPSGWAAVGWIVAALVGAIYFFSGLLQSLATGRKDLLDVSDKKLANALKEKDELQFTVDSMQKQIDKLERDKNEIEKDKTMLMREHHQVLELSVADLQVVKKHARYIDQLEEEINRYREEKGLPPKIRFGASSNTE